jgi:hypothetical protein
MDPKIQGGQTQQQTQSPTNEAGPLSGGINAANSLAINPLKNAVSKTAMRVGKAAVQTAVKGFVALFSSPAFWAAFATAFISVSTFFITFFTGK